MPDLRCFRPFVRPGSWPHGVSPLPALLVSPPWHAPRSVLAVGPQGKDSLSRAIKVLEGHRALLAAA